MNRSAVSRTVSRLISIAIMLVLVFLASFFLGELNEFLEELYERVRSQQADDE